MPALAVILLWVGRFLLASFIARALVGAGLSLVAYHYAVGPLFDMIQGYLNGAPATAAQWIGYFKLDKAFTVLSSAYVIRLGKNALHLGSKVLG